MKYLRILFVALVLGVVFSNITAFIEASDTSNETVSTIDIVSDKIHEERLRIYKERQKELRASLDVYFQKAIEAGDIVGVGVSIVQGDSIIISDGFGKRNIKNKANVDGETVFRLGSLSKGFGGILAASLHAEGKLNFDERIVKYIPEFSFGDDSTTQSVKLSHILSHTSGTPYHSFTNFVEAGLSITDIAKRFDEVDPISKPGEQYSYQNAMFSLSQEVMLKATGEDVRTLLKKRFFEPLGMSHVSMKHSELLKEENIAMPHRRRGSGWSLLPLTDKYYNAVLAGGINASAEDMGKWMRLLLGHNPDVMKSNAMKKAFTPIISFSNNRKYYQRWEGHLKSSYGFGWRIHEFQKLDSDAIETVWHHGGSVNNYRNEIAVFPGSDLGICVLLNGNSKLAKNVIPDLHDMVQKIYNQKTTVAVAEKG